MVDVFYLFDHVVCILNSTLLILLGSSSDYEESAEEFNLINSLMLQRVIFLTE
jgi:hypothetical protein